MKRRKSIAVIASVVLLLVLVITPCGQSVAFAALDVIAENTLKMLRLPFWPFEHGKCFTLDRLDPTCPQCL